jgi:hypothetical protein
MTYVFRAFYRHADETILNIVSPSLLRGGDRAIELCRAEMIVKTEDPVLREDLLALMAKLDNPKSLIRMQCYEEINGLRFSPHITR